VYACIAVALIILGLISPAIYWHWFKTRTFVAVDIPVTLSRGHITTNDFYINLREEYLVEVNVDEPYTNKPDCPLGGSESVLKTHVTLSRRWAG
jgi:hypothetical protein